MSVLQEMVRENPNEIRFHGSLIRSTTNYCRGLMTSRQFRAAVETIGQTIETIRATGVNELSLDFEWPRLFAFRPHLLLQQNDFDAALLYSAEAARVCDQSHQNPEIAHVKHRIGVDRGLALLGAGRIREAREEWESHWMGLQNQVRNRNGEIEPCRLLMLCAANRMLIDLQDSNLAKADEVLQETLQCGAQNCTVQLRLLQALSDAYHDRWQNALEIIREIGQVREVSLLWPDHFPSLIVDRCLKAISSDISLSSSARDATIEQLQALKASLVAHATSIGWDIPFHQSRLNR
jgi:hypothetical protein